MGLIKRGGKWYIRFRYAGKDVWRVAGQSKRKAELALGKVRAEVEEGKFLDPVKGNKITYGELLDRYLREYSAVHKKPNSYEADTHHTKHLRPRFGSLLLKDVTADQVSKMIEALVGSGLKPATVNRVLALLKHSFTKAKEWGLIRHSQVTEVKRLKERNQRVRYLTVDEYRRLLGECPDYQRPIVTTAVNTGMRLGEILSLRKNQVNWAQRVVLLADTKNGENRGVPLNTTMVDLLRGILRDHMRSGITSPYVFVNPLTSDRWWSIRNSFTAAVKRAGIEDFRFHDLRHTAASWLVMSGADLPTVASVLGHKTLAMTQRYSHLSPAHRLAAVEALSEALKAASATTSEAKS